MSDPNPKHGLRDAPIKALPSGVRGLVSGLSGRLLVLTAIFVLIAEVVIYLPSVARFREVYLTERVQRAFLALQVMRSVPEYLVSEQLERDLLQSAGVESVSVRQNGEVLMMVNGGNPIMGERMADMRKESPSLLIMDALTLLMFDPPPYIEVVDQGPMDNVDIQVVIDTAPLRAEMFAFSQRIAVLSLMISLVTAALVFLALQRITVKPIRALISAMLAFRRSPEAVGVLMPFSKRLDELGQAQRELRLMQQELQDALRQKERLAGVGQGVSKIAHDLRNTLATAQLLGERLVDSDDPDVQAIAPRMADAIERALTLCTETMQYGQAREAAPRLQPVSLALLVEEVGLASGAPDRVDNGIDPDQVIFADREHLYRVLLNLVQNSLQAMGPAFLAEGEPGRVFITGHNAANRSLITIRDEGPGFAPKAKEHLFQPFVSSTRRGGTGLGLVICHDLIRAHGGTIALMNSDETGSVFEISLPLSELA